MDNILSYVKWRKDIHFYEREFNDVDALIFAILAYAEWDGIVGEEEILLSQACLAFTNSVERVHDTKRYAYSPEIPDLVAMVKEAPRYQNVIMKKYRSVFDPKEEVQFAAITFVLEDKSTVIAYRGTDSTILGWKEDFRMTYKEEVPSQKYALQYFKEVMNIPEKKGLFKRSKKQNNVYLVGHSKGGNLAMYASICAKELQSKITRVYNFDGPGFLETFYVKHDLSVILPKIKMYLPHCSIIGRLLDHKEEHVVIEGYESGLMQHSAFKWQVKHDGFVKADGLSVQSDEYIQYVDKVLLSKTKMQKENLIEGVFGTLEHLNIKEITDLSTLSLKQGFDSVKEFRMLSNEDKRFFFDCLLFLIQQTKDLFFVKKG